MVAPHNNGRLTRSLVRIPGSGSCRDAGSAYQDFSRVSAVAAMVAAQHPPPQAMMQPRRPRDWTRFGDAAAFGKTAAGSDSSSSGAVKVEAGGADSRGTERGLAPLEDLHAAGHSPGVSADTRRGIGGPPHATGAGSKRPRPQSAEGDEEAPPRAKTPRVMYITVPVVATAGAAVPVTQDPAARHPGTPSTESPAPVLAHRMVPAGRPFMLTDTSLKQLMDERNQLLQDNLALSQRVSAFQQLFRSRSRLARVLGTLGLTVV
ncbi:uncharacterized protein LOC122259312 isoform X3 [Penaeus japonicus]|uniref:uncharacterized protein LOC122259312 isoform X3 n=1 Tax=Penaeus japonicus TaxID=27405 RepID=UPI001C71307E|nr:uncharacterized protein LOC122259312 isoform X3 [Penaeus japonicus]